MVKKSSVLQNLGLVLLAVSVVSFAAGCGGKKVKPEDTENTANADVNANGDSDSGKAMGLQTVHFPFDSFVLDGSAKDELKANADILKSHSAVKIQIEGHCDQRGGIQYNIALGEKRANVAKKFLEDMGISGERITTVSFGKEKPVDPAMTEEAYSKNRRDNFVITSAK